MIPTLRVRCTVMGFLDRAKKLAEQAKDMAEGAMNEVKTRTDQTGDGSSTSAAAPAPSSSSAPAGPAEFGTAYVPGMLGRPGWREQGLTDPAAVLPIAERDRVGVPHTTRSEIVEEPFGMGRRWTAGERSVGLFYQLYPEHRSWAPPGGATPVGAVAGA